MSAELWLMRGGPFHRLVRRLRLLRDQPNHFTRRYLGFVAITWLPLVLIAAIDSALGGRADPILLDYSVHVRLLVSVPIFFAGEWLLDVSCHRCIERLVSERFVVGAEEAELDRVLRGVARACDSAVPEGILLAVAIVAGLSTVAGAVGGSRLLPNVWRSASLSMAQVYYALVPLPLWAFIVLRVLWRWLIWAYVLLRVSRLPLQLMPSHPDGAGGVEFLTQPTRALGVLLFGMSLVLSASWTTRIVLTGTALPTLLPSLGVYLVVGLLVALGPLCVFASPLLFAKQIGKRQYGQLAIACDRLFYQRWIEAPSAPLSLDTQEISALADQSTTYHLVVKMRAFPFDHATALVLLAVMILPVVPLIVTVMPLSQIFRKLAQAFIGIPR